MLTGRQKSGDSYFKQMTGLKKLFWLYLLLLIFEGALRKWVAPQFSAPLLIIRDPVGIWIIWEAYRTHKWPKRWSVPLTMLTVGMVVLFVLQLVIVGNPLIAGLYGLHSYLLPFPLIFIMGENLDERDLRMIGRFFLYLLLPMSLLEVAQYLSPGSAFINRGAYVGGGQISYVDITHVRASGTFSFVVGATGFDAIAAAFLIYGMAKDNFAPKWLLWVGSFALILGVPMTGSRSLVYDLAGVLGCMAIAAIMGIRQFGRVLRIIVPLLLIGFLVSLLPVFSDAVGLITNRMLDRGEGDNAAQTFYYRTFGFMSKGFEQSDLSSNMIGVGMGKGSIAIRSLINGDFNELDGDFPFWREMDELGPISATLFLLFKVILSIAMLGMALVKARELEPLALLLLPFAVGTLLFTTPEQATNQGFIIVSAGYLLAAARIRPEHAQTLINSPLLQREAIFARRMEIARRRFQARGL